MKHVWDRRQALANAILMDVKYYAAYHGVRLPKHVGRCWFEKGRQYFYNLYSAFSLTYPILLPEVPGYMGFPAVKQRCSTFCETCDDNEICETCGIYKAQLQTDAVLKKARGEE